MLIIPKEQVVLQNPALGSVNNVFTGKEFVAAVKQGIINTMNGTGYYHDGEKETDIEVFADELYSIGKYPYVCWYSK